MDLMEIFSPPRIVPHAVRQGLRTTIPTNLDLRRQKHWMTILKPPCAPFLDMFGLSERMKDSEEQVRTQQNALELLEVAIWVARAGNFCSNILHMRRHGKQMISLVTGLKGVMLVTVDLCTLGMVDKDECSCYRTTTFMTDDSVVAEAFRPSTLSRSPGA